MPPMKQKFMNFPEDIDYPNASQNQSLDKNEED